MSTEDKKKWVEIGTRAEEEFVKNSVELFGLDTCINPEKTANKYAADLLLPHGRKGDLKTVRTPFYLSKRYGYDPSLTVTMNHKDYIRYLSKNFVKLDYFYILFWCKWPESINYGTHASAIDGLWCIDIHEIDRLITTGVSKCHHYKNRKRLQLTDGNSSWILPLNEMTRIISGEPSPLSVSQSDSLSARASLSPGA